MLETELKKFIDDVALDYKGIITKIGNINGLPNDLDKTSLVTALISLNSKIASAAGINDAVTAAGSTWSSTKITAHVTAAINALIGGAPGMFDTLKELADKLTADSDILSTVVTALSKRVRVDEVQTFTDLEKAQGRNNIGAAALADIGNPSFDYAAYYAQKKAA